MSDDNFDIELEFDAEDMELTSSEADKLWQDIHARITSNFETQDDRRSAFKVDFVVNKDNSAYVDFSLAPNLKFVERVRTAVKFIFMNELKILSFVPVQKEDVHAIANWAETILLTYALEKAKNLVRH